MGRRTPEPRSMEARPAPDAEQALRAAFGDQLRRRREGLGLTQGEMAERCRVSKVYYGVVELGKKSASLETIARMADGLGIPAAELLRLDAAGERSSERPADKLGRQVAAMASGATQAQMRKILKLVRVYLEEDEEEAGARRAPPRRRERPSVDS